MSDNPALKSPVPLSLEKHKGLKIKRSGSANHIKSSHFAKLQAQEFSRVAMDSPIVFVKDPQGELIAVAMWGFEAGENLFVEGDKWIGGYYPAIARCFPFAISPDPEKPDHFYIGLFEDSDYISTEEGDLFLNEDGSDTEAMTEMKEFLTAVYQNNQITTMFIKKLDSLGLLVEQTLQIKKDGGDKGISGIYLIDREKLAELPDEAFLQLRKEGALDVIYAHLLSLETMERLMRKKAEKDGLQA